MANGVAIYFHDEREGGVDWVSAFARALIANPIWDKRERRENSDCAMKWRARKAGVLGDFAVIWRFSSSHVSK